MIIQRNERTTHDNDNCMAVKFYVLGLSTNCLGFEDPGLGLESWIDIFGITLKVKLVIVIIIS